MALSVAGHLLHFRDKAENVLFTRFAVCKYVFLSRLPEIGMALSHIFGAKPKLICIDALRT
jgi:hypothetical protein